VVDVDVDVGPIGPGGGVTMRVANHSDAPVFQVVGTFVGEYPSTWTERSQTADPVTVLAPGGLSASPRKRWSQTGLPASISIQPSDCEPCVTRCISSTRQDGGGGE